MQARPQTLEAAIGVADLRARQGEIAKALVWLGAVQQHPSFDAQHGEVIAPILERLRQTQSAAEIEAGLARGRELKLETLIEQLLTATSVRYNDH